MQIPRQDALVSLVCETVRLARQQYRLRDMEAESIRLGERISYETFRRFEDQGPGYNFNLRVLYGAYETACSLLGREPAYDDAATAQDRRCARCGYTYYDHTHGAYTDGSCPDGTGNYFEEADDATET